MIAIYGNPEIIYCKHCGKSLELMEYEDMKHWHETGMCERLEL